MSVIVPTYHAEKWVAEAIDSIIAQTYPHIELIIVDDGSRDDTVTVAQHKLRNDFKKRWRIVEFGTNRGTSAARNAGLRLARGSWVQFLDSDDFLAPRKLEHQMAYCTRAPADVVAVCSPWRRCYLDEGKISWEGPLIEPNLESMTPVMCLTRRASVLQPSGLVRRAVLDRTGGFDESLRFWEFEELNVRLAKVGRIEVVRSNEPYYIWRLHRGKNYLGGDEARYRSTHVALGWMEQVLKAVENRPVGLAGLSAAERKAVLDDSTRWARLLYSRDRNVFREYLAMARQLMPDIAPTGPKYVSLISPHIGYENAEAIAKLGRMPRRLVRRTLEALTQRTTSNVFDWD